LIGTINLTGLGFRSAKQFPSIRASLPALVGGEPRARPGEISLAHPGVLFLDELSEFNGIM
jgi:magnesium chelatase family protein